MSWPMRPAISDPRLPTTCQLILTVLAAGYTLYVLREIIVPFVVSLLATLGVESALVFGFLAFMRKFIPTLGPILATMLVTANSTSPLASEKT